jgi:hypothetical protein
MGGRLFGHGRALNGLTLMLTLASVRLLLALFIRKSEQLNLKFNSMKPLFPSPLILVLSVKLARVNFDVNL